MTFMIGYALGFLTLPFLAWVGLIALNWVDDQLSPWEDS